MECVQIEIRRIRRLVTRIKEKRVLAKIWEKKARHLLKTFHLKRMNSEVGMLEMLQQKK